MDVIVSGRLTSLSQALQAASMMSLYVSKTWFESQLARMYCQMFSTGFSSGERDGKKISVILEGTTRLVVVCQPARSSNRTAWASVAT